MKFKLKADLVFEAEDVDAALQKLATHFLAEWVRGDEGTRLEFVGELLLEPSTDDSSPLSPAPAS